MRRTMIATVALSTGTLFYGSVVERNAFAVRRFDVPVLDGGERPLRVLHMSDLHITSNQDRKHAWIRNLARLEPDLVVNTGDTLSAADAIPAVMHSLEPLFAFPGVFVPGNNDYYAPIPKNPLRYFSPARTRVHGAPLPWSQMATAMTNAGWLDLTHAREALDIGGRRIAFAGTDDPHLRRARYDLIAGAADRSAVVRVGVTHSPEPDILRRFAADRYDLALAGHTHGGQIRVPFGPAIVTNCGIDGARARWLHRWDEHMWFHVSAGLGTSPFAPIRLCCRPEATLLTLVSRSPVSGPNSA